MIREGELENLDWEKGDGLMPAIVQDERTGAVLMLAYMNREALSRTVETGFATFWSRSRETLWTKGETSGNSLKVSRVLPDCDQDTLLVRVEPKGPACHRGTYSCFSEVPLGARESAAFLFELERLIRERRRLLPEGSYTTSLFKKGLPEIAKKLGEEAVEVVVSSLQDSERTSEETADLLYHLAVFLCERDVSIEEVISVLEKRHR